MMKKETVCSSLMFTARIWTYLELAFVGMSVRLPVDPELTNLGAVSLEERRDDVVAMVLEQV